MRVGCGLRLGLAATLFALTGCGQADEPGGPDPCASAVYIASTSVPTADGQSYRADLVLLGPRLQPGRQLTDHGRAYWPRFSPDGRQLAFSSGLGYEPSGDATIGPTAIAVIDTAGGEQRDLTADHADTRPAWSPDGGSIGFLRQARGERVLMLIDADGGEPEPLLGGDISWFSWLSDQEIVVARYDDQTLVLLRVEVPSGRSTPMTLDVPELLDDGSGPPLWSPDRTELAFTRYPTGEYDAAARPVIVVHDLGTGAQHTVPGSNTRVNSPLLWTSGNQLMFFKNVAGPDVDVALSADGGRAEPTIIGRMVDDSSIGRPQDDNPACDP